MKPIKPKELIFKHFQKEDFSEYLSWFKDWELNKRLGPLEQDDEWLNHVLNDKEGCTYSVVLNNQLVSVVGVVFPDKDDPFYCISNIAVMPPLRGSGIGKVILKRLLTLYSLKIGETWIAHVDRRNPKAKSFFEQNGWFCKKNPEDNNDMYLMEYKTKPSMKM